MSNKTYDWITNVLLLVALACSLLTEKHQSWYLVLGLIAIAAAVVAILLHFKYGIWREPANPLPEIIRGLQGGSIALRKTAHISVTQALIDKDGHHCTNCPVFNAMVIAGAPVEAVQIWTWKDKKNRYRSLPEQVGAWIYRYDSFDGTPQPIEFDVEWEA